MKTAAVLTTAAIAVTTALHAQGPLTPPGAPAETMKSLDQIEPRTRVTSLPATLSAAGSYYLTGNLQATAASGNAISIIANDVTLDLGGFTLSSTAAVTGHAISISAGTRGVTVKNGQIVGTTIVGISGSFPSRTWMVTAGGFSMGISDNGNGTRIEDIAVRGCRSHGISGPGSGAFILTRVTAAANGSAGIFANYGTLTESVASGNGGVGIRADYGVVNGCLARDNASNGIQAEAATVTGSGSQHNGGAGIYGSHSIVSGSSATYNATDGMYSFYGSVDGGTFSNNAGNGIKAPYATIRGVTASFNGGHGIDASYSNLDHVTAYKNTGSGIHVVQGSVTGCAARENTGVDLYATYSAVAFCKYPTGTTTDSTLTGNLTP